MIRLARGPSFTPIKVHVQEDVRARPHTGLTAEEVGDAVKNGASIFVCGDGGGMAESVHLGLGKMLAE